MIALLMAVSMVGGGGAPEFKVTPFGQFNVEDCKILASKLEKPVPDQTDPEGRVVVMRKFYCVLTPRMEVQNMVDLLKAQGEIIN